MSDARLFGLDKARFWDTETAFESLKQSGQVDSKRTAERRLLESGILPPALNSRRLTDEYGRGAGQLIVDFEIEKARRKRSLVLFAELGSLPSGTMCLYANDSRGARYWVPLVGNQADLTTVEKALQILKSGIGKTLAIFPHGMLVAYCRDIKDKEAFGLHLLSFRPAMQVNLPKRAPENRIPHLQRLEAESIHIIREAFTESDNPVMLYSIGKDSSVMLHLAQKAFFPSPVPFPVLHVDTRWKFQEMYAFRELIIREQNLQLLTYINPETIEKDINPFDHGASLHTHLTKTEGLKQALDLHKFDLAFGGARRDEEKSRAKERIFSFRTQTHGWDPKSQRPELWNLYNTRKSPGESIRVFPLSNWTELDIWQYVYQEDIPVVPLYFAQVRPVVVRDGINILVDDDRMKLLPEEEIIAKKVRFRTLGCYPLTGAIESDAETVPEIIAELVKARTSERQGRLIDAGSSSSMEKKKREGYF